MLETRNLKKVYKTKKGVSVTALNDVSIKFPEKGLVFLLGKSGSGKSTLLNLLGGLDKYDEGEITIKGVSSKDFKQSHFDSYRNTYVGFIFQEYNVLEEFSVGANIALAIELQGKKATDEEINSILKQVDLEGFGDRKPNELSGGQKQRVAIARALATSPKILLCDEATSALDPQTTASILELLQEINRKFNITIVIITHQMSVVRKICSHVAIMKSGEIVETGSVSEIFSHPKSDVARELIRKDEGDDISRAESSGNTKDLIQSGRKVRIVFSENSAFQPVIANMILKFREPVNILRADTRNIGGVAKGEMILEFAGDSRQAEEMQNYLKTCGIELEEVTDDVE